MNNHFAFPLCGLLIGASTGSVATEKDWQVPWCTSMGGIEEVNLADRTRVDCLTPTHAIELEFGPNWAEAIGQSQHYARLTGRKPGILLLIGGEAEQRFVDRLRATTDYICPKTTIWVIDMTQTTPETLAEALKNRAKPDNFSAGAHSFSDNQARKAEDLLQSAP